MLIAVPSDTPGGLDSAISEHFGHCAAFTLVNVEDGEIAEVTVVENSGHEQGGCMAPVMFLKEHEVDILLAGGMGMRPLAGFQQVGIEVRFKEDASSVRDAVNLHLSGKCRDFGEAQTCGGGGTSCDDHHHEPVQRQPIEGPADVREGRVVSFDYGLKDADDNLIDSSARSGSMRYLHGCGNILPGLEKALAGLEAGAHVVVKLPCNEAFGERDETRITEVPLDQLPPHAKVGAVVSGHNQDGHHIVLTVMEVSDDVARLDANHPLAGKDLVFDVTVVSVEAATPQEIEHGHPHA